MGSAIKHVGLHPKVLLPCSVSAYFDAFLLHFFVLSKKKKLHKINVCCYKCAFVHAWIHAQCVLEHCMVSLSSKREKSETVLNYSFFEMI